MDKQDKSNPWLKGIERERKRLVYEEDSFYPSIPIKISSLSQMRKWIFVFMQLWPFQYHPQEKVLRRIEFVKFRIDYKLKEKTQFGPYLFDDSMDNLAKKNFLNYDYAKG